MKTIDLALSFFRSLERYVDAKESEILRDRLLFMQKLRIVDDISFWFEARELSGKKGPDDFQEKVHSHLKSL